jgi:hypothetical protein
VNVVDVAFKIDVIADGMLPIPTLPKSSFSVWMACDHRSGLYNGCSKSAFDQTYSDGQVRRQGHYDVHVIRQNHNRIDGERVFAPR